MQKIKILVLILVLAYVMPIWGKGWQLLKFPVIMRGIAYGNSSFVVVGEKGLIMTNTKEEEWKIQSPGRTESFNGINYTNNVFIAFGNNGLVLTSEDGFKWLARFTGISENLQNVIYADKKYIFVGQNGLVLISKELVNWEKNRLNPAVSLYSIAFGNNICAVVGENGSIFTTEDGIKWMNRSSATNFKLRSIVYGNIFVAVGDNGTILTSQDGLKWQKATCGIKSNIATVRYEKDYSLFIAGADSGEIITSVDGDRWFKHSQSIKAKILGIAYGDSQFIAVGENILAYCRVALPVKNFDVFHSDKMDPRIKTTENIRINGTYPSVIFHPGTDKPYWMWYTDISSPGKLIIKLTKSSDGKIWDKPVDANRGLKNPDHVQVVYLSDQKKYRIYYWNRQSTNKYSTQIIHSAESMDGTIWINDEPIKDDKKCKLINGNTTAFNNSTYGPSAIMYNPVPTNSVSGKENSEKPTDYRFALWYDCADGDKIYQTTSLAVSDDGKNFYQWHLLHGENMAKPVLTHGEDNNWDSIFSTHGSIVPGNKPGLYYFFYSGGKNCIDEGIGCATSTNYGVTWRKSLKNPILEIEPDTWHSIRCCTPCVLYCINGIFEEDDHLYKIWVTGDDIFRGLGYLYLE